MKHFRNTKDMQPGVSPDLQQGWCWQLCSSVVTGLHADRQRVEAWWIPCQGSGCGKQTAMRALAGLAAGRGWCGMGVGHAQAGLKPSGSCLAEGWQPWIAANSQDGITTSFTCVSMGTSCRLGRTSPVVPSKHCRSVLCWLLASFVKRVKRAAWGKLQMGLIKDPIGHETCS